ncbi:MAG: hypothetical protein JEZ03_15200 [Bacteroidales bacterium]|nr:hypothetical protein [Bacteroidales bacterium]
MKSTLTIFICLLTFTIQAQTFDELIRNGDKFYDEEKYLESAKEYEKAFNLEEGNAGQYYNAACSWALTSDTIQAISRQGVEKSKTHKKR